MKDKGISFEQVKKKLVKETFEGADSFSGVDDIPKNKIFELIYLSFTSSRKSESISLSRVGQYTSKTVNFIRFLRPSLSKKNPISDIKVPV